jgi:hypothetical protein
MRKFIKFSRGVVEIVGARDSPDAFRRAFLGLPSGSIYLLFQLISMFNCLSLSEIWILSIRAEFRENQP